MCKLNKIKKLILNLCSKIFKYFYQLNYIIPFICILIIYANLGSIFFT